MENRKKSTLLLSIIIIVILIIGSLGLTYAINFGNQDNINFNTLELGVNYTEVFFSTSELVPINDSKISVVTKDNVIRAEFNIKANEKNKNDNVIYDILIKELNVDCELLSEYVKFNLYKNNILISSGNFSPKFDKEVLNNKLILTNKQQKLMDYNTSGDSYVLIIWISDPCDNLEKCTNYIDQNYMLGKKIEGKLSAGLYTTKKNINELEERTRETDNDYICS